MRRAMRFADLRCDPLGEQVEHDHSAMDDLAAERLTGDEVRRRARCAREDQDHGCGPASLACDPAGVNREGADDREQVDRDRRWSP